MIVVLLKWLKGGLFMLCIRYVILMRFFKGCLSFIKLYFFCLVLFNLLKIVCIIKWFICCILREWVSFECMVVLCLSGKIWVFCCKWWIVVLLIIWFWLFLSVVCKLLVECILCVGVIFLLKLIIYFFYKVI